MSAAEAIAKAVGAVARGEVIGIPTDTVYGLGADPFQAKAADALFEAKRRPETLALPVLIARPSEAEELAVLDERAAALIGRYWPGPLTLVLGRRRGRAMHLGGDPLTVGLRCPSHPAALELLAATGPLAVTSANLHGGPPATTAAELRGVFGDSVPIVVDGGHCDGRPSTVLSLAGPSPVVLRQGDLTLDELVAAMPGGLAHPREPAP